MPSKTVCQNPREYSADGLYPQTGTQKGVDTGPIPSERHCAVTYGNVDDLELYNDQNSDTELILYHQLNIGQTRDIELIPSVMPSVMPWSL